MLSFGVAMKGLGPTRGFFQWSLPTSDFYRKLSGLSWQHQETMGQQQLWRWRCYQQEVSSKTAAEGAGEMVPCIKYEHLHLDFQNPCLPGHSGVWLESQHSYSEGEAETG